MPSSPHASPTSSFPAPPTPVGGTLEAPVCFPDISYMFDSPLSLLPPKPPVYSPAECPSLNWAIGNGWSQNQLQQVLPSPPPTPLLLPSTDCASKALVVSPSSALITSPASDGVTSVSPSPFGCQPEQTSPQTPLPPTRSSRPAHDNGQLILRDMRQTEEGNELHTRLRGMGLSSSEIRIVWKRLHKVPWAEIAEAESAIEDPVKPGTLSMRLRRLKRRQPYLKELFPSKIRAAHRRVRSPDNGMLSSHERRGRGKHRDHAQDMIHVHTASQ